MGRRYTVCTKTYEETLSLRPRWVRVKSFIRQNKQRCFIDELKFFLLAAEIKNKI